MVCNDNNIIPLISTVPVGDILQTLQSDRERRFTNFLRALFSSGLSELLQNKGKINCENAVRRQGDVYISFQYAISQILSHFFP